MRTHNYETKEDEDCEDGDSVDLDNELPSAGQKHID
jgi:hypothetical protein